MEEKKLCSLVTWASPENSETNAWNCHTNYMYVNNWNNKWNWNYVRAAFALYGIKKIKVQIVGNSSLHFLYIKNMENYFTFEEMLEAHKACIKNKSNTINAMSFDADKMVNLMALLNAVNGGTYKIGTSIAFVVLYPKAREVFAANYSDRVIHHLVMLELLPYLEKEFIDHAFACREGKGVFYGIKCLADDIKECTEGYTKDAWILKMDFKAFFMSIEKQMLLDCVLNFIREKYPNNRKKELLLKLCELIIMHHPEKDCIKKSAEKLWDDFIPPEKTLFEVGDMKGLPIGNLPSQIFETLFMTPFDIFVTKTLGFKYYGRYVDDFYIVSDDKRKLKKSVKLMENFAKEKLHLSIHPSKRYMQHYTKGVTFIGAVIKPNNIQPSGRMVENFHYKLETQYNEPCAELAERFVSCVNSYFGFFRQFNTYNKRKKIIKENVYIRKWKDSGIIIVDDNFFSQIKLSPKFKQK